VNEHELWDMLMSTGTSGFDWLDKCSIPIDIQWVEFVQNLDLVRAEATKVKTYTFTEEDFHRRV
jgi:hypothetical protein